MKQILILFFILFGSFSCIGLKKETLYELIKKHFTEPLNNNLISSVKLSKPEYYYDMLNNDTINEMYSFIRFTTKEGKKVQRIVNEFQDIDDGETFGTIPVDQTLMLILQGLMDKYTFPGVNNSWLKLCYYFHHYGK